MGASGPLRLLVVCSGNTCRSPMAAALLERELTSAGVEASVVSAGVDGPAGRPASVASVEVMAEVGIDLGSHRSRLLDRDEVVRADVVLVMTAAQGRTVADRSENATGLVFLPGEFARLAHRGDLASPASDPRGPGVGSRERVDSILGVDPTSRRWRPTDEIEDPYGASIDRYRATRDRLAADAAQIVAFIAGDPRDR